MNSAKKQLVQQLRDAGLKSLFKKETTSSLANNGAGYFHPSICKLVLNYNTPRPGAGGDSIGMIKYIKLNLERLGASRPYVEVVCAARSGPPEIEAHYNCGAIEKVVTSRWKANQIHKMVEKLCDSSGPANKERRLWKIKNGAGSTLNELNVPWNPFHAPEIFRP